MRELPSEVHVLESVLTNSNPDKKRFSGKGIWDTGATGSAITSEVAKKLGLKPITMTDVHTAGGIRACNVYMVDLLLPNDILVSNVQVTEADMTSNDVLIGMDIITLGDFAITNFGGKTRFSFSIPSTRTIDFVQEERSKILKTRSSSAAPSKTKRKLERQNKKKGRKK